jgi:hypothetical protein
MEIEYLVLENQVKLREAELDLPYLPFMVCLRVVADRRKNEKRLTDLENLYIQEIDGNDVQLSTDISKGKIFSAFPLSLTQKKCKATIQKMVDIIKRGYTVVKCRVIFITEFNQEDTKVARVMFKDRDRNGNSWHLAIEETVTLEGLLGLLERLRTEPHSIEVDGKLIGYKNSTPHNYRPYIHVLFDGSPYWLNIVFAEDSELVAHVRTNFPEQDELHAVWWSDYCPKSGRDKCILQETVFSGV